MATSMSAIRPTVEYGPVALSERKPSGNAGRCFSAIKARATILRVNTGGTTLTIGPGLVLQGHSGQIGQSTSCIGTPANVTVINQGSIAADTAGGTINIRGQIFANQGLLEARNGGHLNIFGMAGNVERRRARGG